MSFAASRRFGLISALTCALSAGAAMGQGVFTPVHPAVKLDAAIDIIQMDPIDPDALLADEIAQRRPGRPHHFAKPITDLAYTPANSGSVEDLGNGRIAWRLRIDAPGARSINLGTLFDVPRSVQLYLLNPDGSTPYRVITHKDGTDGEFWTPIIEHSSMELYAEMSADEFPAFEAGFVVTAINLGFQDLHISKEPEVAIREGADRGVSQSCNIDVECSQGDPWSDEIRSVGLYIRSGFAFCSGAMINNTAQDRTPYFIMADHCGTTSSNDSSVVIYWNYQNSFCRTPGSSQSGQDGNGSLSQFTSGTTLRMSRGPTSDVTLLELSSTPPSSYNVHWAGWDRNDNNSSSGAGIHHPSGAEKRISIYNFSTSRQTVFIGGIGNVASYIVGWSQGITEGGSSGSPLFNNQQRMIGVLSGGSSSCSFPQGTDAYVRIATAWNGTNASNRLVDWLDPISTGQTTLDGVDEQPEPAPGPFDLLTPADGANNIDPDAFLSLTWETSADATVYTVTVATDPALNNTVIGPIDRASPSLTIFSGTLSPSTTYYWGVVAKNNGPDETASTPSVASFTTLDPAPGSFSLTSPADGATDVDASVQNTFSWTSSSNADDYTITIASTSTFDVGTIVFGPTTTASTSINVPGGTFADNTTYYWEVVANNGTGQTSGSPAVASFTTIEPAPTCAGDINGDGFTDLTDFNILGVNFGAGPGATLSQGDLSGDGFVDLTDFNILGVDFGCTP